MIRPKRKAVRNTTAIIGSVIVSAVVGIAIIVAVIIRAGGMVTSTWTTVVMPMVGLFLLAVALWQLKELPAARELDRDGVLGEGVVIGKWSDSGDESRNYYVAYLHGDGYQASQRVSRSLFRALGPADTVDVRYLPRDPDISRIVVN